MSNSKFYEDLIKGTLGGNMQKTASAREGVKSALNTLSDDQIEVLAQEIGVITKKAEATVEETATEKARTTEGQGEKDLKDSSNDSTTDGTKSEDGQKQEAESKAEGEAKPEEKHEDAKKEEVNSPIPEDANKDDEQYSIKSASEELIEILKEGAAMEEAIEKNAYMAAEEILKKANFGVADYIYNIVEDEKLAEAITEKAEKIAFVTGEPLLKVADDLLGTIAQMVQE